MIYALIAVFSLFIGLTTGATIMFATLYPQLILLRSMLVDKHAGDVRKTGVKSVVAGIEQPESISSETARIDLKPADLFERRRMAEEAEMEQIRQGNKLMAAAQNLIN